jgi:hypothetical protein
MAKTSAAEGAGRVQAWRASGLTSNEYCRCRNFGARALLWGSSQRRRKLGSASSVREPRMVLARMVREGGAPALTARAAIKLEVGGARVEVAPGTDRATVSMVLEALHAAALGGAP